MGALARRLSPAGTRLQLALAALLVLGACREAPELFEPVDRGPLEGTVWQLTHSVFDDRTPAWLSGGDSVVYATTGFDSLPPSPNVLVGIPAMGGVARPILGAVQSRLGVRHRLVAPAVSRDGERLAYAEYWDLNPPRPFEGGAIGKQCSNFDTDPTFPILGAVMLRVRRLDAPGPIEEDPSLLTEFDGHELVLGGAPQGVNLHITRHHPFHALFEQEGVAIFRPTWSPDGQRLAFSDGLRIHVWDVGSPAAIPIEGTDDGVLPAWSPDGSRIAFTRLGRGIERVSTCNYTVPGGLLAVQERHLFALTGRTLALVRPDGSELRELGEGEAPAWTPDGSALYATRGNQLWRISIDGSAASPVANTDAAREPAVSPDGNRIAFTRRLAGGDYNVWVLSLDGSR